MQKLINSNSNILALHPTLEDIALLTNNYYELKKSCEENRLDDICSIAKKYRLLEVAKYIYGDTFVGDNLDLNIDTQYFTKLHTYHNNAYIKLNVAQEDVRTMGILLLDIGLNTWDANDATKMVKSLSPHFDELIAYGTGNHALDIHDARHKLENIFNTNHKLDLAVVNIMQHGTSDVESTLHKLLFPINAKIVIYIVTSCIPPHSLFSTYPKQGDYNFLISAAKPNIYNRISQDDSPTRFDLDDDKFASCFDKTNPLMKSLFEYFSDFIFSTPCVTAHYKGDNHKLNCEKKY